MSFSLMQEEVRTCEVVCQKQTQAMVECDVIVPDVKPDIRKVLEVSGTASVSQALIQPDKVMLQGTVKMTALYLPDGGEHTVCSLSVTREFSQTVDCRNARPEMQVISQVEPESFDSALINSRKLNLRCTLGIAVKVSNPMTLSLPTGTEDEDDIALYREPLRLICNPTSAESQIILREQLEMPSGKPTIGEILKISAVPTATELCMMENRALAKGQVQISVLYLADDPEESLQTAEFTLPFTEILDAEGVHEDMEGEVSYILSDMYCEVRENADGDPSILSVELALGVTLRGSEIKEIPAVTDAYSLNGSLTARYAECHPEQLLENSSADVAIKDRVDLPQMLPPLQQVCDLNARAKIDRVTAENGQVTVSGTVQSRILYLSQDDNTPICSFRHISEFSHSFSVAELDADTACDARVSVSHIGYTLSGDSSLELRINLALSVKSLRTGTVRILDTLTESPAEPESAACMVLYFVQPGDRLWDIAKHYRTTTEAIQTANHLDSDTLTPGQKLKITR